MTKIDINTHYVYWAGSDLAQYKEWGNVWQQLNVLHDLLSDLEGEDASIQGLVNTAKNEIRELQWDYMRPVSNGMDLLGNICKESAVRFEDVDKKWEDHFSSTRGETPISAVMNDVKEEFREPVKNLILSIAHNLGDKELEELIERNIDTIVNNVLDALPGFYLDICLIAAGGAGFGLLVKDLANVAISSIVEIACDELGDDAERCKSLYSAAGLEISYEDGKVGVGTVIDTYDLRGENPITSVHGFNSWSGAILDADDKLNSLNENSTELTGYSYQCFGQEVGSEKQNKDSAIAHESVSRYSEEIMREANTMPEDIELDY